jgi:co-chaperonin GroES (HSP10)
MRSPCIATCSSASRAISMSTTKSKKAPKKAATPTPYGLRVLVELDPAETTSAGGIVLTTSKHDVRATGVVLSVGDDALEPLAGKRIAWLPIQTMDLEGYDRELVIVPEDAIIAIL